MKFIGSDSLLHASRYYIVGYSDPLSARGAPLQVLFEPGELGFFPHVAEVVALKVMIGNVTHLVGVVGDGKAIEVASSNFRHFNCSECTFLFFSNFVMNLFLYESYC